MLNSHVVGVQTEWGTLLKSQHKMSKIRLVYWNINMNFASKNHVNYMLITKYW